MRMSLVDKGKCLALILALFALSGQAYAAEKLTQIADHVYAYVNTTNSSKHNSFGANAGMIVGQDGIVVIDTLMSAKEAKRFIRDIRTVSRKPIKYVINTHYHLDHVFGNSEFVKLGAVVIAQENDKKAMVKTAEETLTKMGEYGLTAEDMRGTVPAYPAIAYGDRMEIDLGNQTIELIHAHHSHTDGDTLVYLRDRKILFTGDILFTKYHPFVGEGNIEEWVKELDDIQSIEVEKIIPGHGPLSGKKDLDDMKDYLLRFDELAKMRVSQSNDIQKIADEIQATFPARTEGIWLIMSNIQMKYWPHDAASTGNP